MKCSDCKDGFYYPFMGPPEPCQTCAKSIKTQPLVSFSFSKVSGIYSNYRDYLLQSLHEMGLIQPIEVILEDGMAYVLNGNHRIAALRKWCLDDHDGFVEQFPDYQIPIQEIP